MASPFLYLLLPIICNCYSFAFAVDGHDNFVLVSTTSLDPEDVCSVSTDARMSNFSATPGSNGVTAPLTHRYGPCAPSQSTDKRSTTEMLRRSRARAKHIISSASMGIPTYLGGFVDSLDYMVTVALGTPAVPQTVLVDTGSDLTWVQCKPCNTTCYPQKDPLFDPSKSSTYAPIPCGSNACNKLLDRVNGSCTDTNGTAITTCMYGVEYGDGSETTGVYSKEVLTLAPGVTVKSFIFGCGHDQHGPNDRYDGLLGLGRGPESLAMQTSPGGFSYCLPPVNSRPGFLALGTRHDNMSGFSFTPMLPNDDYLPTSYNVMLTGISVAGKPLNVSFSDGITMIIDSGTIPTPLPSPIYKALRSAFREAMAAYPLVQPKGPLDTCYNLTGHSSVSVPRVALTFSGGATINLDVPNGVLSGGCLAFDDAGYDQSLGILGSVNQRTLEVLYDVAGGKVGFRAGCLLIDVAVVLLVLLFSSYKCSGACGVDWLRIFYKLTECCCES